VFIDLAILVHILFIKMFSPKILSYRLCTVNDVHCTERHTQEVLDDMIKKICVEKLGLNSQL